VRVTDGGGLTDERNVTVRLTDVNERPTMAAATLQIDENSGKATAVEGSANRASDVDAGDSLT